MASVTPQPSGKWGRRSLDTPVNLVPYIDLMTTIITFLMMTAIWAQIATLEVQNGASGIETNEKDKPSAISILISNKGFVVSEEGANQKILPLVGNAYDLLALAEQLKMLKGAHPQREEVRLNADDGVKYDSIVKVIDLATGLGLRGITLKPMASG
jgi:biopolymer transport protein TolR